MLSSNIECLLCFFLCVFLFPTAENFNKYIYNSCCVCVLKKSSYQLLISHIRSTKLLFCVASLPAPRWWWWWHTVPVQEQLHHKKYQSLWGYDMEQVIIFHKNWTCIISTIIPSLKIQSSPGKKSKLNFFFYFFIQNLNRSTLVVKVHWAFIIIATFMLSVLCTPKLVKSQRESQFKLLLGKRYCVLTFYNHISVDQRIKVFRY